MIYQFSMFFPNSNYGNNQNPFWALCGKIRPLALNSPIFCDGIGPLQLGVVLVFSGFVVRGIVTCSHTVVYLEFWHVLMTGSVLFMCGLSDRFKSFLMISCLCIEWKLYLFGDLLDWSNVWAVSKAINHADSLDFLGSRALILFLYFSELSIPVV